ncbi:MAG: hypothetical protein ACREFT_13175 [Acetobacteraceae bacterium]
MALRLWRALSRRLVARCPVPVLPGQANQRHRPGASWPDSLGPLPKFVVSLYISYTSGDQDFLAAPVRLT